MINIEIINYKFPVDLKIEEQLTNNSIDFIEDELRINRQLEHKIETKFIIFKRSMKLRKIGDRIRCLEITLNKLKHYQNFLIDVYNHNLANK